MLAGDNSKPAANASYRNLLWENFHVDHSFNIGTKIQRNKEIGTIDSWGPFFRVTFDLIIHSIDKNIERSSILSFLRDIGIDRLVDVPSIFLQSSGELVFYYFFSNDKHRVNFFIEENRWYNIIIEQKSKRGKVIRFK